MSDIQFIIKSGGSPYMAIPTEMRLKINIFLIEPGTTHSKFHGNFILPEAQNNTSALAWPPAGPNPAGYDNLAMTCKQLLAEMAPLKSKALYDETLFVFSAFFSGPVSRLGGNPFLLRTFAPLREIQRLHLRLAVPRRCLPNSIRATMINLSAMIGMMPALLSVRVVVDFAIAPTEAQWGALLHHLSGVRAPALSIECALVEGMEGSDMGMAFGRMLVATRAVDVSERDREDEEGYRAGFPDE